jgi:hypothetical protein
MIKSIKLTLQMPALFVMLAMNLTPPLQAQATQPQTFVENVVPAPGTSVLLRPGDRVVSGDGRFNLLFQSDGNLVLLQNGTRIWSAGTQARFSPKATLPGTGNGNIGVTFVLKGCFAAFQSDGNFVVYGNEGVVGAADPCSFPGLTTDNMAVLWSSRTDGNPNSRLAMQSDGNTVIYTPSNRAIWSTRTCCR